MQAINWESDRPYPMPGSLAFWKHCQRHWIRRLREHVAPRLPTPQGDAVTLKTQHLLALPPRNDIDPYINDDGAHRGNMAERNLEHLGKLLNLDEVETKLFNLAWCLGRETSMCLEDGDSLLGALSLIEFDQPTQGDVLSAWLDCDAELVQRTLTDKPYKLVMLGVLRADLWNLQPLSLIRFTGTESLVDTVDMKHSHHPGSLKAALLDLEFDALTWMNADEIESELEDQFGEHPIANVYRDGADFEPISAASLSVLVEWRTGFKLPATDFRWLDRALEIPDVANALASAACAAMQNGKPVDERMVMQALYQACSLNAEA
jgi:hypothetical protein